MVGRQVIVEWVHFPLKCTPDWHSPQNLSVFCNNEYDDKEVERYVRCSAAELRPEHFRTTGLEPATTLLTGDVIPHRHSSYKFAWLFCYEDFFVYVFRKLVTLLVAQPLLA